MTSSETYKPVDLPGPVGRQVDAPMSLDIQSNRRARKYSNRDLALRVVWACLLPLFRYSPRLFYGWRNLLLRALGATIGSDVQIHPRARIMFPWNLRVGDESAIAEDTLIYNLGSITLGRKVTVSHGVQLCAGTHDYRHPTLPLLKPPVTVEDSVWVCTEAFVGPGVSVGTGAVVGARAVVTRDVEAWSIVAGNPARKIGERKFADPSG
jgi:putative colanic acid biosynthesis acetyltransferase WcaF